MIFMATQYTKRQMVSAICGCMQSLDRANCWNLVISEIFGDFSTICLSVCLSVCLPHFHLSANFAGLNFLSRYSQL